MHPKSLKILCFGDSLTEGYSGWGSTFTPYADGMRDWLKKEFRETEVTVEVDGKSGDCVDAKWGNFISRIQRDCTRSDTPFDWIIILGGTNDLGMGKEPDAIFKNLMKVYDVAFEHGAHILALTVPECAVKNPSLDARRSALNLMIMNYKPKGFENHFHTFDFFATMPYHSLSGQEQEDIWDDGLHLTPYGYSVMGDHVAQRLHELCQR